MLDHHPNMACMQESDFIVTHYDKLRDAPPRSYAEALQSDWLWPRSGLSFPESAKSYAECAQAFLAQRHRESGKPSVGATVLNAYHPLPTLFPEAKYVHLLRDGRPVAASIVQMGWAGNLYVAADRWRRAIEGVQELREHIPAERWLEIRYEELLADPKQELTRICEFLGYDFDPQVLKYDADTTYDIPDAKNAHRWRDRLTAKQIRHAEMAAGALIDQLGYERLSNVKEPGTLRRKVLALDSRVRRTLFRCKRYGTWLMLARWFWRKLGVRRPELEARFEAISESYIR